jgi:hypothetical protein
MPGGIRPRSRCVIGLAPVTLVLLGSLSWPASTRGGPVVLSWERLIRNNHASDRNLEPVKTATGLLEFDAAIEVESVFDGNFDPATGRDSTITSIARVGQHSIFGSEADLPFFIQDMGFAGVRMFDTHSTNPVVNLHEVESVIDVTFRLDAPHEFSVVAGADVSGGGYLLALDGPGGRSFEFIDDINENAGEQIKHGLLAPGVYRLRQTGRASTTFGSASAQWGFNLHLFEAPAAVPLPPGALPALATAGAYAGCSWLRRRGLKS